jgi:hypothetical protein
MKYILILLSSIVLIFPLRSQDYSGKGFSPTGLKPETIDTLWILPAEFRIGTVDEFGLRNHSPILSENAVDSANIAIENYFGDTDVKMVSNQFVRYSLTTGIREFDSQEEKEIQDSLLTFYHKELLKHVNKKKPINVPSYFFDIMEEEDMNFALLVYGEGFVLTKAQYRQQLISDIIGNLVSVSLTGMSIKATQSQFESNLTLIILDRKNRNVAFIGHSIYPIPPYSEIGLHFQMHSMFDEYLQIPIPIKSDH